LQCSGASWYPLVYENYDEDAKRARALRKREQKLSYALSVANRLTPKTLVVCAGPPVFLDPALQAANRDPSFPLPSEAREWLGAHGYRGRVEVPLPGDRIDLATGLLHEDGPIHARFSWERTAEYVREYARQVGPRIAEVYRRAEAIPAGDLYEAFRAHF